MNKNTTVSLTLQIKGQQASQEMKRISDQQVTATTKINQQWTQIGNAQAKFVNTAKAGTRETINTARAGDQLLRTNKMLENVLRQQSIQTKIQGQLYKQNVASAQQLANWTKQIEQSSKRTQQHVQQTTGSMGLMQKGGAIFGGVTGGYMAAKAVAATPLERGRNFYKGLYEAGASITGGFKGMSAEQAKAARDELKVYAKDAVRMGHGTVEGVAEAANILAASGNYEKVSDLKSPLVAISKSSFASGASEEDMARLAGQVKQFGIPVDRTQAALDRMMQSGYAGGFELKDMSQFLPEVLSTATGAGYRGERGLNMVTTHLQLARKYTGTAGEAKTNIEDLYGLVSQKHFKDAIAKNIDVEAGDPTKTGKKGAKVFDLTTFLANNALKDIDSTTSIAMLMNRQLSKNKNYNKLNADLAEALQNKDSQRAEELKSALELVIRGEFGDIFHNKQSLSGISAVVTGAKNGDLQKIGDESWSGEGSVERVFKDKSGEEFAQAEALEQETILAQIKIYETVNGKLGGFEKGLTLVMQSNQGLAAAALAATGALTVLAATAGGGALGGVLTGGKSVGKPPIAGGTLATGGKSNKFVKGAGALLMAPVAYDVGYSIGTGVRDTYMKTEAGQKFDDKMGSFIAHILSPFSEEAKAAVEAQDKYDQMIAEQQKQNQQSERVIQTLLDVKGAITANKPVFNFGGSLLDGISQNAQQQEKRHGAPPPYMIVK
ncbi:phage tail tape measure protein [Acinetobacter ursingii]|uniref:phage tail tape measure protein n=1 Tax=Acinetobacter ursingii TaxID=108980 RepID=UPI000F771FD1|nr:phage tail tape measure protein [Acinetobacter ursingii]MCU4307011.1 phage tail tape measure protein [Acinetobacter ursingii]MCU4373234.1 phage tail tape measure protein [Acinetobacter ursingii]RSO80430.1 hypothetical protein EA748_15765 [Acinetobacter ursingii]